MKRNYVELMRESERCIENAEKFSDVGLKVFWYNASKGFKNRARNLPIEDAK